MKTIKELQKKETSKMTTEEYINFYVENDDIDLDEMYRKCLELEDVCDDSIYIRESLIDIMCEHAKAGRTFYAMARDLDDNSECNYFWFDWSCWGDGCTPIETKEELAQVLLDGSL